jgi:hypothetical protein
MDRLKVKMEASTPFHVLEKNMEFSLTLSQVKSSQVTNHKQCILNCAKNNSTVKKKKIWDNGLAQAPLGFQAGWSDCMHFFSLFLFILFAHLKIMKPRHSSP